MKSSQVNFADRLRRYRFEKLVGNKQNIGHLLIEAGLNSLNLKLTGSVIKLWDKKIGTPQCSCMKKRHKPEILLATSVISHEPIVINNLDFTGFAESIEHLIKHHNLKAVIGLGINGLKDDALLFEKLPTSQKNFLLYLKVRKIPIGCRGTETKEFLRRIEFKDENLFLTGCPSLQLIKEPIKKIPFVFSRVLTTGALETRLDLLESRSSINTKFLFIPQDVDSYSQGLEISKSDHRIEIFLPATYDAWLQKIKEWQPEIALGTRLHGNMAALSLGIPTMFMSGDIRTREITQLAKLPFADDLIEICTALDLMTGHHDLNPEGIPTHLASQIRLCLREFIDRA